MAINQVRPDTPLANTPEPRFVQDTIKPKTWQKMSLEEKSAKKKELIKQGGIERFIQYKDSVSSAAEERRNAAFSKGAALRGMTTAEYSRYLEKSNKRPDAPLEGLETSKACKRGSSKGSCSTGQRNRGESLRDNR